MVGAQKDPRDLAPFNTLVSKVKSIYPGKEEQLLYIEYENLILEKQEELKGDAPGGIKGTPQVPEAMAADILQPAEDANAAGTDEKPADIPEIAELLEQDKIAESIPDVTELIDHDEMSDDLKLLEGL